MTAKPTPSGTRSRPRCVTCRLISPANTCPWGGGVGQHSDLVCNPDYEGCVFSKRRKLGAKSLSQVDGSHTFPLLSPCCTFSARHVQPAVPAAHLAEESGLHGRHPDVRPPRDAVQGDPAPSRRAQPRQDPRRVEQPAQGAAARSVVRACVCVPVRFCLVGVCVGRCERKSMWVGWVRLREVPFPHVFAVKVQRIWSKLEFIVFGCLLCLQPPRGRRSRSRSRLCRRDTTDSATGQCQCHATDK